MLNYICEFFPSLFSSQDKKVEEHIVFTLMAIVALIGLAYWDVVHTGNHFDAQAYGEGVGITLAGSGGAAWGKSKMNKVQQEGDSNAPTS